MGLSIDRSVFTEEDYLQAGHRLRENLAALKTLLARPEFGVGEASLGAEMEMSIVGRDGEALALNQEVLAASEDPRLTLEIDRFNLEYNLAPVMAAGEPFSAMRDDLSAALDALRSLATRFDGTVIPVGILPTLEAEHLQPTWMTDVPRFHALVAGIRRMRGDSQHIRIDGEEPLETNFDTCAVEGANTSFQVHLRVNPRDFAAHYNAAQLATPLALAVSANSPFFLGHSLWDETRIALFKQAVETRRPQHEWRRMTRVPFGHGWVRDGAFELFAESCHLHPILIPVYTDTDDLSVVLAGGTPELAELRLQQGTVWNWNRPVYDPAGGGHLRIEFRALPSGPTPLDMAASAAYLVGLTVGLRHTVDDLLPAFPFRYAEYNFYRAAQRSLNAELLWPVRDGTSPREVNAADLCREMIPVADEGLAEIGVSQRERRMLLGLIGDRLDNRRTPASWLRQTLKDAKHTSRRTALRDLVNEYAQLSATGRPVTEW